MTPARPLIFGMVLTAAAGFIDAVGFIELGGYFVSFMSGNTTQGGAALVAGAWPVVTLTLSLVLLFFTGSVLGAFIANSSTRWGGSAVSGVVALSTVATVLLSVSGVPPSQAMLALAATAGAQNAILPMRGAVRLGATFVTGTLYTAGHDLALALKGRAPSWRWLQHLVIWIGLFAGATLGAFVYQSLAIGALAIPAVIYTAFAVGGLFVALPQRK